LRIPEFFLRVKRLRLFYVYKILKYLIKVPGSVYLSKRYVTILFLSSDSTGKTGNITLPVWFLKAARNLLIILILGFSFIVYDYGHMRLAATELTKLRKENTSQKIELQTLSSKITDIESGMAKLKLFDKKLRIIANLEELNQSEEVMGMGGASPDEDTFPTLGARRNALINQMHSDLTQLEGEAVLQERSFTELQEFLLKQSSLLASTPAIMPTRGWTTSTFGKRKDPFTGRRQRHRGMDISNRVGTPVVAPADGIVTKIMRMASLGRLVEVSHGYGIKTRYGHLSKTFVKVGQKVKRGKKIAAMGNTGRSTGPHLHYEVIVNGVHVNPSRYVLN
jgi:murein DD-endopeptidase MepM/ murein hydrolase activator NlpD